MARKRTGFQKKIDHVAWEGFAISMGAVAAGTQALTFLTQTLERPVTVMRIRGQILGYIDGASAPPKGANMSLGVIKVPEGTSTTVVYNPVADDRASWMMYETFFLGYEEMVTDVIDVPGLTSYRKEIDVKAMRIVRPDEELQFVIENTTFDGAAAVNFAFAGRILIGF